MPRGIACFGHKCEKLKATRNALRATQKDLGKAPLDVSRMLGFSHITIQQLNF